MIDRNVELINIAKIDLLKGRVNSDLDSLSKILLDNYHNRFECEVESTYFEDSVCPPNDIVDDIISGVTLELGALGNCMAPFALINSQKITMSNYVSM